MMASVFYYFTHDEAPFLFPGAPFILGGILMLISTILAYRTLKKNHSN